MQHPLLTLMSGGTVGAPVGAQSPQEQILAKFAAALAPKQADPQRREQAQRALAEIIQAKQGAAKGGAGAAELRAVRGQVAALSARVATVESENRELRQVVQQMRIELAELRGYHWQQLRGANGVASPSDTRSDVQGAAQTNGSNGKGG